MVSVEHGPKVPLLSISIVSVSPSMSFGCVVASISSWNLRGISIGSQSNGDERVAILRRFLFPRSMFSRELVRFPTHIHTSFDIYYALDTNSLRKTLSYKWWGDSVHSYLALRLLCAIWTSISSCVYLTTW